MAKRHLDEYSGGILPEVIVSPQHFIFTKDGSISSNYNFVSEDRGKLFMDYINNLIGLNPKSKTKVDSRKKFKEGGKEDDNYIYTANITNNLQFGGKLKNDTTHNRKIVYKSKSGKVFKTREEAISDNKLWQKILDNNLKFSTDLAIREANDISEDIKRKSINKSPYLWSKYKNDRTSLLNAARYTPEGNKYNLLAYIFDKNTKGNKNYTGSRTPTNNTITIKDGLNKVSMPEPYINRDLVELFITGKEVGVEKYTGNPLTVNNKSYDKQYNGVIYPYSKVILPLKARPILENLIKENKIVQMGNNKFYGNGDNTIQYIDNVGEHGASFKKDNKGNITFNPYDIWDFKGNYSYSNIPTLGSTFEDIAQPSSKYPNSGPFVLRQDNIPIEFVEDNNANLYGMYYKNFANSLAHGTNKNESTKLLKEVLGLEDKYEESSTNLLHANYKNGGTIHIKPENRGKFNATKERTGKTTEELTHSKNPLTRKRAIFAQNAAKWKH